MRRGVAARIAAVALGLMFVASLPVPSSALAPAPSAAPGQGPGSATTTLSWAPVHDSDLSVDGSAGSSLPAPPDASSRVVVTLPFSNRSRLTALLSAQTDPGSPAYQQYLTGSEFDEEFGGSPSSAGLVYAYFASFDVSNLVLYADRATISFTAPLSTIGQIFHTTLGEYRSSSAEYFAPATPPELPSALAGDVVAVEGLSNFTRPSTDLALGATISAASTSRPSAATPCASSGGPFACTTVRGVAYPEPVSYGSAQIVIPSDLQVAYNTSTLYASSGYPSDQTVATILWSDPIASVGGTYCSSLTSTYPGDYAWDFYLPDVDSFYNYTLPAGEPHPHVYSAALAGSTYAYPAGSLGLSASCDSGEADGESTLDLEMIGSMAPGAAIYQVFGGGGSSATTDNAFSTILNPTALALSATGGSDSAGVISGLKNVSVISNSWIIPDTNDSAWYQDLEEAGARGIAVLSSSGDSGDDPLTSEPPGSSFAPAASSFDAFGDISVGGTTLTLNRSTLAIASDAAWYNRTAHVGSTGGVSSVFALPNWQSGSSQASAVIRSVRAGRGGPDIAAMANNTPITLTYGGVTYNVTGWAGTGSAAISVGGTSVATPLEAGIFAMINHTLARHGSKRIGFLDPTLYAYGQDEQDGALTHRPLIDVTQGSNYLYPAGAGYDLVTGWGSIDAGNYTTLAVARTSAVWFNETGLASGTPWGVGLGGNSPNTTTAPGSIRFALYNGSYTYTIAAVNGYAVAQTGTFTVSGSSVNIAVPFTRHVFALTFSESGLPSGADWTVTIGVASNTTSAPGSLGFRFGNGTYSFSVTPIAGYWASAWRGAVTIQGASAAVAISFSPLAYVVTFSETGLPAGTAWTVVVGGRSNSTAAPGSDLFALANGSFSYAAHSSSNYAALPPGGTFTVAGASLTISVAFAIPAWNATFRESGLLGHPSWTVYANALSNTTSAPGRNVLALTNGTYTYTFGSVAGYQTPTGGTFVINGGNYTAAVGKYLPISTYAITFNETGLPTGTTWSIDAGGALNQSPAPQPIVLQLPNGTYQYTVGLVPGYRATPESATFLVAGRSRELLVNFSVTTYAVTFEESGLANGTLWSVTVHGQTNSSNTSSIGFVEANSSYLYAVTPLSEYSGVWNGRFTVAGAPIVIHLLFSRTLYVVTFEEYGLTGERWAITYAANTSARTPGDPGSFLSFESPNGTYGYNVSNVPGWRASSYTGAVAVDGRSPPVVDVNFTQLLYAVTFVESGLSGAKWAVTFNASTSARTSATAIPFKSPNGTYAYNISGVPGWTTDPWSGEVSVDGAPQVIDVPFTRTLYTLQFNESGLAPGVNWSIEIEGGSRNASIEESSNATAPFPNPFTVANGTYNYTVAPLAGYSESPRLGAAVIAGHAKYVLINFLAVLYPVVFNETGLLGEAWAVTFNGEASPWTRTNSIGFTARNGTGYAFNLSGIAGWKVVGLDGQVETRYSGTITVSGHGVLTLVTWAQVVYNVTFTERGLPLGLAWSIAHNGTVTTSHGTVLTYELPNVTGAPYAVGEVPGYRLAPGFSAHGAVSVDGAAVSLNLSFVPMTYSFTIDERGLAVGVRWAADVSSVGGSTEESNSTLAPDPLVFALVNGTYSLEIPGVAGYYTSLNQSLQYPLLGSAIGANVTFFAVNPVTFSETGLSVGTGWSVTVDGNTTNSTSAPRANVLYLPNGSHAYAISGVPAGEPIAGYVTQWTGSFDESGPAQTIAIVFHPFLVNLTFNETGLPRGTRWGVTVGSNPPESELAPTSVVFELANGSYAWVVRPVPGYLARPSSNVTLVGPGVAPITIAFVRAPPTLPSLSAFFPTSASGYLALGLLVLLPLTGGLAVLVYRRGRRRGNAAPAVRPAAPP